MSKKELRFWFNTPQTVKEKSVTFKLYGDGRHYSKKRAIEVLRKLKGEGEYYFTTRRWRDGLGDLTNNIIVYVRRRYLGLGDGIKLMVSGSRR